MRVHHVGLTVKNLEESVNFYKENFGFIELNRYTKPGWTGSSVILELGDFQLELFSFSNSIDKKDDLSDLKVIGLKHLSIEVCSVEEKFEEFKAKGLDVEEPIKGTTCAYFCFVKDPNGIPIELYEK